MGELSILRTGAANMASVVAAFERLGVEPVITSDPSEVLRAGRLVLPGVGTFDAVATALYEAGLAEPLRQRLREGRPTLAICLGLQLLAASSEESGNATGLGILPGRVRRLPKSVVVPQLGWNRVEVDGGCRLLESGTAYYANSFCLKKAAPGWSVAWSEHGDRFVAAVEKGPVLACQFHPELSGAWGEALLSRWLEVKQC